MKKQNFYIILFILFIALGGCTFSEPIDSGSLESVLRVPDKRLFVASAIHKVYKEPTGFVNTFPNGGVTKILEQSVRVYLVDGESGLIRVIFESTAPKELETSFGADVLGFKEGLVFFQLSGCEGKECHGDLNNYKYYSISLNGKNDFIELTSRPKDIKNAPNMLSMSPGESKDNYYRISVGHNEISHRFSDGDEFYKAFIVDKMGVLLRYL